MKLRHILERFYRTELIDVHAVHQHREADQVPDRYCASSHLSVNIMNPIATAARIGEKDSWLEHLE